MPVLALLLLAAIACATPEDPARYRLTRTGTEWADVSGRTVVADVVARYPEFFAIVLDPGDSREPDLRPVRSDLEQTPVDRRNYDALNAVAVAYFELNYRAEAGRGGDFYLGNSLRAAHLLAIPWRAYGEIQDARLRDAILDFFSDAASGEKVGTASTAPRLERVVASLAPKEDDPARSERIARLVEDLRRRIPDPGAEPTEP